MRRWLAVGSRAVGFTDSSDLGGPGALAVLPKPGLPKAAPPDLPC